MAEDKLWATRFQTFDDPFCKILVAYSAGDAFGAYYEFNGSHQTVANKLQAKDNWPFGGVSDDTLLTLLTIQSMEAQAPGEKYLELLRSNLERLRGLGPTTRSALGLPVKPSEVGEIGNTNGGMMRAALCGLTNFSESSIAEVVCATHPNPEAIETALEMARLFRGAPIPKYPMPAHEVGLNPTETFQAICAVVNHSNSVEETYIQACKLGGDTDTVAALSGALYVAKHGAGSLLSIDWLAQIAWLEIFEGIDEAVKVLRRNS